jgi:hypothetical protein
MFLKQKDSGLQIPTSTSSSWPSWSGLALGLLSLVAPGCSPEKPKRPSTINTGLVAAQGQTETFFRYFQGAATQGPLLGDSDSALLQLAHQAKGTEISEIWIELERASRTPLGGSALVFLSQGDTARPAFGAKKYWEYGSWSGGPVQIGIATNLAAAEALLKGEPQKLLSDMRNGKPWESIADSILVFSSRLQSNGSIHKMNDLYAHTKGVEVARALLVLTSQLLDLSIEEVNAVYESAGVRNPDNYTDDVTAAQLTFVALANQKTILEVNHIAGSFRRAGFTGEAEFLLTQAAVLSDMPVADLVYLASHGPSDHSDVNAFLVASTAAVLQSKQVPGTSAALIYVTRTPGKTTEVYPTLLVMPGSIPSELPLVPIGRPVEE